MKQVRTAALQRLQAPPFLLVAGTEHKRLRLLGWMTRCLFWELIALADPKTGLVATSYAVLEALLDFDMAPTANDAQKANRDRIRRALDDLVLQRLVNVDRVRNEREQGLFLKVKSRVGISSPARKRARVRA